jgi:Iap family predicted aminopeptidase
MSRFFSLLFLPLPLLVAQTISFRQMNPEILEARLRTAHPKASVRYERLRELFLADGCTGLVEQQVKGSKEPNLICSIEAAGENAAEAPVIVVGAHMDCYGGDGVVDNWTGAVMLPSLAQFMRESPRKHSFRFIGFASEEKGLVGSRAYLKSLSKQERARVRAVITMDSLGLSATKFWPNGSDAELAQYAANVAQALNLSFLGVNTERVGTTDSQTFHEAKIPTLSLHSLTPRTWMLINSPNDTWKILSLKDYLDTHKLVSALLVYLDHQLQ